MASRTWTLRIKGDESGAVRAADNVEKRYKKLGENINRDLDSNLTKMRKKFDGFSSSGSEHFKKFSAGFTGAGKALAITAGTAFSANFMGAIVSGLASGVGKVAHGVAAIGALLPAAALTGVLAFGALKIAVSGVGDALKAGFSGDAEKFAEATKNMSQSAKEFLGQVVGLKPRLDDLRKTVQENLFERIDDQVRPLADLYLPAVQRELSLTARGFGEAAGETARWLQIPSVVQAVTGALGNSRQAVGNLTGGIPNLVAAFLPLVTVGSTFLPGLTGGFQGLTLRVAEFMQQAERTGRLREFIQGGLDKLAQLWETIKQVGRIIEDLGGIANKIFPDMGGQASGFLDAIERMADSFNRFLETTKGASVASQVLGLFRDLVNSIFGTLQHLAEVLGRTFGPVLPDLAAFLSALADLKLALISALEPALKVLGVVVGGVLRTLTKVLTWMSESKVAMAALAGVVAVAFTLWAVKAGIAAVATLAATWPILLIGAALGILALLVVKHWGTISRFIEPVVEWFQNTAWPVIQEVANSIGQKFQDLVAWVKRIWPQISEAIGHVLNVIRDIIGFYVNIYSALWDRFGSTIIDYVQRAWGFISDYIGAVLQFIQGIIQFVLAIINGDWGRAWDAIKMMVGAVWDGIMALIGAALNTIRFIIGLAWEGIKALTGIVWDGIKAGIMFVWDLITSEIGAKIEFLKGVVTAGLDAVKGIFSVIWGAISGVVTGVWDGIVSGVRSGVNAVIDVINWFVRLINNIPGVNISEIGHVGEGPRRNAPQGTANPNSPGARGFARGGVPGFLTDGPRAIVGEGNRAYPEAVIATDPRYRRRNLGLLSWAADKLGVGVPQFGIGGILGDIGGFIGGAVDVLGGPIANQVRGAVESFARDMSVEALGGLRSAAHGMVNQIPGPLSYVRDMGRGIIDNVHDWARGMLQAEEGRQAAARASASAGGGGGGMSGSGLEGGAASNRALGQRLAMSRGWGSGPMWDALDRLVMSESGWRNTAQNPTSTAYGIGQFLNSTWAGVGIGKTSDPALQIEAMFRYIAARYGNPIAAWNFKRSHNWYERGGILAMNNGGTLREDIMGMGKSGQRYLFHKNEGVVSTRDQRGDGGPKVVFYGDLVIKANSREEGKEARRGFEDWIDENSVVFNARTA